MCDVVTKGCRAALYSVAPYLHRQHALYGVGVAPNCTDNMPYMVCTGNMPYMVLPLPVQATCLIWCCP